MTPLERLDRLATVLENRPKDDPNFDISIYALINECGTVACALGWGAADPILNDEGLVYVDIGSAVPLEKPEGGVSVDIRHAPPIARDTDERIAQGIQRIRDFFGLKREVPAIDEFMWLFTGSAYPVPNNEVGPHDVAARIRILIQEKSA